MRFLLGLLILASSASQAAKLSDVEFPDQYKVGDKNLELNGLGMRVKEKFGFNFKVYVGALYLPKKSQSPDEILNLKDVRVVKLSFLRRVGGSDLAEAFVDGFGKNCTADCEESKKELMKVTNAMPDIMDKGTMEFQFFPDKVEYNIKGRKDLKGTLTGAAIAKNFLAIFIGSKPPTEDLKSGMLGMKK